MRADDIERYRGRWVAISRTDEHAIADASTLEQLQAVLRDRPHGPVLIRRIPALEDPIFVGLG